MGVAPPLDKMRDPVNRNGLHDRRVLKVVGSRR
jgi:hypothetical protein